INDLIGDTIQISNKHEEVSIYFHLYLLYNRDVGNYWKNIMKDQAMPDVIIGLFHDQDQVQTYLSGSSKQDNLVKDFDIRPNVIIYHKQSHGS
ncbi:hypothetical protein G4B88_025245, partial [Cannabis sativa]